MGPPHEPLATVLAPQTGAMGLREQEAGMGTVRCWGWPKALGHPQQGVGIQGTKGPWFLWHPKGWFLWTHGLVAHGPKHPFGGDTVARGSRGGDIHPWVFPGILPDGPPTLGARLRPL